MINEYKKLLDDYTSANDIETSFEKVNNELYISTQSFTFEGGALNGEQFTQEIFVTEAGIISACSFRKEISDIAVFDELSVLFNENYHTEIKYEPREKTVYASISFAPDDKTDDEDFFLLTTLPWLCMRMIISIYRDIAENPVDMNNYKAILEDGDIPFDFPTERYSIQQILFEDAVENEDFYMNFSQIVYKQSGNSPKADILELKHNNSEDSRYFFEHIHFPDLFYINPDEFIRMAASGCDKFLNDMIKLAYESRDITKIPEYNHFEIEVIDNVPERRCIRIIMPEPVKSPDCSDVFLFNSVEEGASYYTVEIDKDKDNKRVYFIGCWNERHIHTNYGQYSSREEAIEEVMDMIMLME